MKKTSLIVEAVLLAAGLILSIVAIFYKPVMEDSFMQPAEQIESVEGEETQQPPQQPAMMQPSMQPGMQPQQPGMQPAMQPPQQPDQQVAQQADQQVDQQTEQQMEQPAFLQPIMQPIMQFTEQNDLSGVLIQILPVIMYLLVGFYVFLDYKKPHGNSLKLIMIAFALYLVIFSELLFNNVIPFVLPLAAIPIAFMSGRLNRFVQNTVLMTIVAILLLIFSFGSISIASFNALVIYSNALSVILIWAAIVNAYVLRFKEHKLAGTESGDETQDDLAK